MITFAVSTLGCKVNTFESVSIVESLKREGFIEIDFNDLADVYIIFTCAVTNVASSKSRKKINQAIRQNKDAVICVVGCYVQLEPKEIKDNENIDILVGSNFKNKIPEYIKKVLETKEKIDVVSDVRLKDIDFENLGVSLFDKQVRAYLKIQDGCNQFCSYCIIPYARGKERSLSVDEVVSLSKTISLNHKEIVLAGIHTGRYFSDGYDLTKLVKKILEENKKIERLRISSIEITEITDELIKLIKNDNRIARHLHIPLQSGSDEMLKLMRRPYDTKLYLNRINYIRNEIPDISISTDVIVGFPKETEKLFNDTLNFIKECSFSFIHVFPFSLKEGTDASKLKGFISNAEKKERVKKVSDLSKKLYYIYKETFINKELEVLIEKHEKNYSFGHSSEYIPVYIKGIFDKNQIIKVKGTHISNEDFYAIKE
ncbi:MAG: tRNA (N(6)-L-threonylcarbamoyladenosine(37)-C(2))-methylthiotransferase MtaB [Bacillota bacterium]|nr:tRNA (N(6)-L-threonylcarbamoyladenosine(37)-C(2))-methylthiotransferase MtaB [Bacillota bacterium]NLP22711.1 tRNA (N(6)-L-threonylcarbamoyladenosine(37)-C(2))-methylthiotransferase MtaB [Erysipelotrichaceae bacterium]